MKILTHYFLCLLYMDIIYLYLLFYRKLDSIVLQEALYLWVDNSPK